jgi:hypothetical protein
MSEPKPQTLEEKSNPPQKAAGTKDRRADLKIGHYNKEVAFISV